MKVELFVTLLVGSALLFKFIFGLFQESDYNFLQRLKYIATSNLIPYDFGIIKIRRYYNSGIMIWIKEVCVFEDDQWKDWVSEKSRHEIKSIIKNIHIEKLKIYRAKDEEKDRQLRETLKGETK